ncbi:hypothetical protein JCM33374_g4022 [Metschnikowia sp. JCM 33374]|nr:hypothetical protein JCM33374_g4022 [Metschnikowia sp. JCM 33374]
MSLRDATFDPSHDLLSEKELIDMYMREMCPNTAALCANSNVSDLLADSLGRAGTTDLQEGLNLIEYMSHEGLSLDYVRTMAPNTMAPNTMASNTKIPNTMIPNTMAPHTMAPHTMKPHTNGHYDKDLSFTELSDVASVDTCGKTRDSAYGRNSDSEPESESDFEDIDSLMDCGGRMSPGPCGTTNFNLYEILDSIQEHHSNISCGFQQAHSRLERLREQNHLDSVFLGKLNSSNERMREKTHELRSEVTDIFNSLEVIKRESGLPQNCSSEPLFSQVYPLKRHEYPFTLEPWTSNSDISGNKMMGFPRVEASEEMGGNASEVESEAQNDQENDQESDHESELQHKHGACANIHKSSLGNVKKKESTELQSPMPNSGAFIADKHTGPQPNKSLHSNSNSNSKAVASAPLSLYPAGASVLVVVLVGCWLFNWIQIMMNGK